MEEVHNLHSDGFTTWVLLYQVSEKRQSHVQFHWICSFSTFVTRLWQAIVDLNSLLKHMQVKNSWLKSMGYSKERKQNHIVTSKKRQWQCRFSLVTDGDLAIKFVFNFSPSKLLYGRCNSLNSKKADELETCNKGL